MTKASQNTPGPWHRNIKANGKYPVIFTGRNQHIATISQQKNNAETEANIDLISAAPELLKQIEAALAFIDIQIGVKRCALQQDIHAVIAKARGEQ